MFYSNFNLCCQDADGMACQAMLVGVMRTRSLINCMFLFVSIIVFMIIYKMACDDIQP